MILDKIVNYKRDFNELSKKKTPLEKMQKMAENLPRNKNFLHALKKSSTGLIAEIKKASPSKGLIRENFSIHEIATAYENSVAACISCLTDEKFFQGSEPFFREARNIINKPMLRKDFTIDKYNVYEAKVMGANAILLIASILDVIQLQEFYQIANLLGMDTLFEVHNQEELDKVLPLRPEIIGINNRNLHTFETSVQVSLDLIPKIPKNVYIVSESSLNTRQDILMLKNAGAHGFLMGEVFMREKDIEKKINEIFHNF